MVFSTIMSYAYHNHNRFEPVLFNQPIAEPEHSDISHHISTVFPNSYHNCHPYNNLQQLFYILLKFDSCKLLVLNFSNRKAKHDSALQHPYSTGDRTESNSTSSNQLGTTKPSKQSKHSTQNSKTQTGFSNKNLAKKGV